MARSEVADSLARWRSVVRLAESQPPGSHERAAAETQAQELHREYLAAVMRITGRGDQVESAIESTGRPMTETSDVFERSQESHADLHVDAERATEPA
jgi:hypothetical protein